jgi:DNA gyrase subunit B
MSDQSTEYSLDNIQVLRACEHVRRGPGMYVGDTGVSGLHHLLWELVNNCIDEHLAGFGNRVVVELLEDGGCRVSDNGRGIPIDRCNGIGRSTLEILLTEVGAGPGRTHNGPPTVSGGLGSLGLMVVNALSCRLVAEVARDGRVWRQEHRRGRVQTALATLQQTDRTGTSITFWPDPEIFASRPTFEFDRIAYRLSELAGLHRGLALVLADRRIAPAHVEEFCHPNGLAGLLRHFYGESKPVHPTPFTVRVQRGWEVVEVAAQWTRDDHTDIRSYCNGLHTWLGGEHQTGFRRAVASALGGHLRRYQRRLPGQDGIRAADREQGLLALVSVQLLEPVFLRATRTHLGNPEANALVYSVVRPALSAFLEEHPDEADAICRHILTARLLREKSRGRRPPR